MVRPGGRGAGHDHRRDRRLRMIPNELIRDALEAALVVAIKDPAGSPKSLQPFLKFQKMPARAMPAVRKVLDTDDAFRERVASVVVLGVLDQAGVLFLTRPEGWEAELERLAVRGCAGRGRCRGREGREECAAQAQGGRGRAHEGRGAGQRPDRRARAHASGARARARRQASGRDHRGQRHLGRRQPSQASARARVCGRRRGPTSETS